MVLAQPGFLGLLKSIMEMNKIFGNSLTRRFLVVVSLATFAISTLLVIAVYLYLRGRIIKDNDDQMLSYLADFEQMLHLQYEESAQQASINLAMAKYLLTDGQLDFADSAVVVEAKNRETNQVEPIKFKPLTMGGKSLYQDTVLVDALKKNTGSSVVIFQRIPGGFMRIASSAIYPDGTRGLNVYLPDSLPLMQNILQGKPAKAGLIFGPEGKSYFVVYEPIYLNNELVGMIYAGRDNILANISQTVASLKYNQTGYPFIVNSQGTIIVHPVKKSVGLRLLATDYSRHIVEYMFKHKRGIYRYAHQNKVIKIQYFTYYEPLDIYLAITIPEADIIDAPLTTALVGLIVLFTLYFFFVLLAVALLLRFSIIEPIKRLVINLKEMALGKFAQLGQWQKNDEIGEIYASTSQLADNLKLAAGFASEIGKGNYLASYHAMGSQDLLGNALLTMRDQLKSEAEAEQQRRWATDGLTVFSEVIRQHSTDLDLLVYEVLVKLIQYLKANQGAIFLAEMAGDRQKVLVLKACYAYDRRKFAQKTVQLGEGLLGQVFLENETTYLTKIPDHYARIRSGLGEAGPTALLLVPIKTNLATVGIVELALFQPLTPHQIEWVEQIAGMLASSLAGVQASEKMRQLLNESQIMTENLRSQEEEMRQNFEELVATQEELGRKSRASDELVAQLQSQAQGYTRQQQELHDAQLWLQTIINSLPKAIFWKDAEHLAFLGANQVFASLAGFTPETIIGKTDFDCPWSREESEGYRADDREVINSRQAKIDIEEPQTNTAGTITWMRTTKVPIKDADGKVKAILGMVEDITKAKLELREYHNEHKALQNALQKIVDLEAQLMKRAISRG